MAAHPLDRLIGWFAPRQGLARHIDRQRMQRAFEAASPRDGWRPRRAGASANADHQADAAILRSKARALVQNVPYIAASLRGLVSATVGTGILPRATGNEAARINALLAQWSDVCDADGRLDLPGLIALAYRTAEQDGEALVRLRPRLASDGLPVPLQLQLLEVDWIDSHRTQAVGNNRVINGIEYDALGRRVAYYLWDSHPGDTSMARSMRAQSRRVDASEIIHLYAPERPGQGRGFTRFASVIARVRDLQLYEDAEISRKNLETRLAVLYSGDPDQLRNPSDDPASRPVEASAADLGDLPSGGVTQLPSGASVTVVEPKAAGGYVDYVKQQLHVIMAGIGVPYEIGTGDMSEVNFSSARVRRLDFQREVEQVQWLTLVPRLLKPLYRAFIDAAVLSGRLRETDYRCDFSFPKWAYVNPEQEIKADTAEIAAGLATPSEKLRQRGYNPADVFAEMKRDFDTLRSLGVLDILLLKETGKGPASAPTPPADGDGQQAARTGADAAALQRIEAMLSAMESRAPAVTIHQGATNVTVPERSVTVAPAQATINVQPAEVRAEIVTPPATVHVQVPPQPAPEVRVVNEVAAPVVNVEAPPRQTVTDIQRDAEGRITRTVSADVQPPAPAAGTPRRKG